MKLPVDAHLDALVSSRRNIVLVAEPGAGKTTRVPPALAAKHPGVVVLEPRRLAARMAARRVAEEVGTRLGDAVGYTVRFDDKTSKSTTLRFVTEGIFTRQLSGNPTLEGVSTVVFDELHERHLDSDVALAMVRDLQRRRSDLRIIAMSATLDAASVATFLDAEVVRVEGRTYPVSVEHQDVIGTDLRIPERKVAAAVRHVLREEPDGDVLVFLPGAAAIRRAREACEGVDANVVVLHGDLDAQAQDRAVRKGPRRKVILSTNIAESSVTIEGVVAVVDSGLARQARVSPWTGLSALETVRVSRASAIQRAGRAGRMRPGRCVRLFAEHDFRARPEFDSPEIERADLSRWVLMLRARGHDPAHFPFFEPPPAGHLAAADALLRRLGAIHDDAITEIGHEMLRLPVHPRLARLALAARERGAAERGCLLASIAAERDIRSSARFDGHSDTVSVGSSDLLAQLEAFESAEAEQLRGREMRARGLDANVFRSVTQSRNQLARLLRCGREPEHSLDDEEEALRLAVLQGFPDRVGRRRRARSDEVLFAQSRQTPEEPRKFVTGVLSERTVVREAEHMVVTQATDTRARGGRGRVMLHAATAIEPEWLLDLFPDEIEELDELRFDPELEQVVQRTGLLYDGIVLEESVRRDPDGERVAAVLADTIWDRGLSSCFDTDELDVFRRRVAFAAQHGLELDPIDDDALRAALRQACLGHRTLAGLRGVSLIDALRATLDPKTLGELKRMAPEFVALPRRKRCPVHYEVDRDPWIQSRLQDFFGLREGPRIAKSAVPLVLHLLAPNRRAVQVTTDLAGFWTNHYPRLRKELMRRYSRHAWPEDPLSP